MGDAARDVVEGLKQAAGPDSEQRRRQSLQRLVRHLLAALVLVVVVWLFGVATGAVGIGAVGMILAAYAAAILALEPVGRLARSLGVFEERDVPSLGLAPSGSGDVRTTVDRAVGLGLLCLGFVLQLYGLWLGG